MQIICSIWHSRFALKKGLSCLCGHNYWAEERGNDMQYQMPVQLAFESEWLQGILNHSRYFLNLFSIDQHHFWRLESVNSLAPPNSWQQVRCNYAQMLPCLIIKQASHQRAYSFHSHFSFSSQALHISFEHQLSNLFFIKGCHGFHDVLNKTTDLCFRDKHELNAGSCILMWLILI